MENNNDDTREEIIRRTYKIHQEIDDGSRTTLNRLELNDSTLTELWIGEPNHTGYEVNIGGFNSNNEDDFSRLGTSISMNTHLTKLHIDFYAITALDMSNRGFFQGLIQNTSINNLYLSCFGRGGVVLEEFVICEILRIFQEKNNLNHLDIRSPIQIGGNHILSLPLQRCTNLTHINLTHCNMVDEELILIVYAIRGHPSLKMLNLLGNIIGNDGCTALDTLLLDPNCNIEHLGLIDNQIGNRGGVFLANSLINNTKLKTLRLINNPFTRENPIAQSVEDAFSTSLCDTSSINATYTSNHTVQILLKAPPDTLDFNPKLKILLGMNDLTNQVQVRESLSFNDLDYPNIGRVAIRKIIKYHPNALADIEPFLADWIGDDEQSLKGLPHVIAWFHKAREAFANSSEEEGRDVERRMLSAIYQFARALPTLIVPPPSNNGIVNEGGGDMEIDNDNINRREDSMEVDPSRRWRRAGGAP